ncbi:MAG: HIT family protein [Deltaproteobacteria bacterium]|nr:HIT family protein [Deltaproteobacteria bacterium]
MIEKPDCIFCQIAAGRAPAARITESAHALAFMDLFPAAEGHVLVIPKTHYENVFDSDEETLADVHLLARRVALAMRRALAPEGMMMFQLNGAAAGQTVFHYHAHLLPRRAGSELRIHGRAKAELAPLTDLAARITAALE